MSFTNSSVLWKITSSVSIIKIKVLHWPHNQYTILYNNLSLIENHIIRWYIQPNNCNKYISSIIHYKMLKVSYLIITSYTGLQKKKKKTNLRKNNVVCEFSCFLRDCIFNTNNQDTVIGNITTSLSRRLTC